MEQSYEQKTYLQTGGPKEEFSLGAFWIANDAQLLHVHNEDSDQTEWMPRLL